MWQALPEGTTDDVLTATLVPGAAASPSRPRREYRAPERSHL
ncbi:hypothetical protein ACVLV4_000361 [Rathayibacter agropyri]